MPLHATTGFLHFVRLDMFLFEHEARRDGILFEKSWASPLLRVQWSFRDTQSNVVYL